MLQKYKMEIDRKKNQLTIKEFAFIGKQKNKSDSPLPKPDDFLMAHKVTYDMEAVSDAIANGKYALIEEIRTDVFFPAETCAELIADQVIDLFSDESYQPVEFFFDDRDMLAEAREQDYAPLYALDAARRNDVDQFARLEQVVARYPKTFVASAAAEDGRGR